MPAEQEFVVRQITSKQHEMCVREMELNLIQSGGSEGFFFKLENPNRR